MRKPRLALIPLMFALLAGCATPHVAPLGDRPGEPELTSRYFITADGLALPLYQTPAEGEAKGAILGLHGFNDHAGAFEEARRRFNKAGYAFYA